MKMPLKTTSRPRLVPMIPLFCPEIRGHEWKYVKECLDTGWVSSAGQYVERFERFLADYVKRPYAVACINGTAALHTALLVSGIQSDEEVLVPALTFVATANVVRYVGAWPVFMDVESHTAQMDPQKVIDFLTKECEQFQGRLVNRITKRTVRAIIPVHLLGHPVDMDPILEVAKRFGLIVIEDAAAGIGAMYKGRPVGGLGDMACFSFNGNKVITSGGGGMLVTHHQKWADKARYLTTQAKDDTLEQIHNEIGYNYRLTNIQAALGLAQMEQLEKYLASKKRIAECYLKELGVVAGIKFLTTSSGGQSNFWLFTILVDKLRYGIDSRELLKRLQNANIQSRPLGHPLHTLKPYKECFSYRIEVADQLYRQGLSLPCFVGLKEEDQRRIIRVIKGSRKTYEHK